MPGPTTGVLSGRRAGCAATARTLSRCSPLTIPTLDDCPAHRGLWSAGSSPQTARPGPGDEFLQARAVDGAREIQ